MLPHDEAGSGPPIVLIHSGVTDRRMWGDHLGPLAAAGYRVVAIDLPGFGDAELPPGEQAPWQDVLGAMDELGIERAALVGNSMGGAVALRVALVAPERVSALVRVAALPTGLDPSPDLMVLWHAEQDALDRGDVGRTAAAVVD